MEAQVQASEVQEVKVAATQVKLSDEIMKLFEDVLKHHGYSPVQPTLYTDSSGYLQLRVRIPIAEQFVLPETKTSAKAKSLKVNGKPCWTLVCQDGITNSFTFSNNAHHTCFVKVRTNVRHAPGQLGETPAYSKNDRHADVTIAVGKMSLGAQDFVKKCASSLFSINVEAATKCRQKTSRN